MSKDTIARSLAAWMIFMKVAKIKAA